MNKRVIFTNYHCMDNVQSVHKGLHLYLVILFLLFVSRILAFNFMLMSVKIRRYRGIIIIIIITVLLTGLRVTYQSLMQVIIKFGLNKVLKIKE